MTDYEELEYLRDQIQLERDELAKYRHAAQMWNSVRPLLMDAGCKIECNCHIPTVVAEWLHFAFTQQPECTKRLTASGWDFSWKSDIGFVEASHPLGGKRSVVEVLPHGLTESERNEIGIAISKLLGGSQEWL